MRISDLWVKPSYCYCPHCGAKVLSVVEVGCFEDVKVVGE